MDHTLSRDGKAFISLFVAVTTLILLYVCFANSFEPATFQVGQRSWRTVSELYHYESDTDCSYDPDTERIECVTEQDKVVDERYVHSGMNNDPITYHLFVNAPYGYSSSYYFYGDVSLIVNETKTISYKPSQNIYESLSSGMYCIGEVGWFNHVRRLNCSGR